MTRSNVDGVLTITFDRDHRRNAITPAMFEFLAESVGVAVRDEDVRCLLLRAEGRAFSAGADLSGSGPRANAVYRYVSWVNSIVRSLGELPLPTVCLVNGATVGVSCGLAFACDITLASPAALFSMPFAQRSLVSDAGTAWQVTHAVGVKRAKEILMLGEAVEAHDAAAMGLITRVVPAENLDSEGRALARRLAGGPTVSLALIKKAIDGAASASLAESMEAEASYQHVAQSVADAGEAGAAFVARREPRFSGWGSSIPAVGQETPR